MTSRQIFRWSIIAAFAVALLVCEGCATRGYVDRQCYETKKQAREYTSKRQENVFNFASEINDKVEALRKVVMTDSEIRTERYRKVYLKQIQTQEYELNRLKKMLDPEGVE